MKILTLFAQRLKLKLAVCGDVHVLISIFTDIAMSSPKSYKMVLSIISLLIDQITTTEVRTKVVKDIYAKFQRFPDIGEIQIWMQHITYQLPDSIDYDEGICRIVNNEPDVDLWNNEWLADAYKKDFPMCEICTDWLRDNFTPVIDIDEVSLFDVY